MKISSPSNINKNKLTNVVDLSVHPELGANLDILLLEKNNSYSFETNNKEYILLLFTGEVRISEGDNIFSLKRNDVRVENSVFVRASSLKSISINAITDSELLLISAPNNIDFQTHQGVGKQGIAGLNAHEGRTRRIKRPLYDTKDIPSSVLFVGELITYQGSWACYPPHRHVEPEIYFYRFFPKGGYAFVEDGDTVHRIEENDVVGVINSNNHSQTTAPGFNGYILWIQRLTGAGVPIVYSLDPRYAYLDDQS